MVAFTEMVEFMNLKRQFAERIQKSLKEGNRDLHFADLMRSLMEEANFDFTSRSNIDALEDALEPEYKAFQQKERELTGQYKNLLIEAGATEQQLEWGNVSQVRPTWRQECQMRKLEKQIDESRLEALPMLSLVATLNEARERLTTSPQV